MPSGNSRSFPFLSLAKRAAGGVWSSAATICHFPSRFSVSFLGFQVAPSLKSGLPLRPLPFTSFADADYILLAATNTDFASGVSWGERVSGLAVGLVLELLRVLAEFPP